MNYEISYANALTHIIRIKIRFRAFGENSTTLKLAKWRPGRYEFMNFASNIYQVYVYDKNGNYLNVAKTATHEWVVDHKSDEEITIEYDYYANDLDGGGTYLDENQLYINPINCLLYVETAKNEKCKLTLRNWDGEKIATQLKSVNGIVYANNYDELFDSPIICSHTIVRYDFTVEKTDFAIWIQGKHKFEIDRLLSDFKSFTKAQFALMPECFDHTYHYLIQIVPYKFYHGVEHSYSTTIVLGPGDDTSGQVYENLLGVCSHELFHFWNVKKIRPKELVSYNYDTEAYFNTGYVAEGFTTYYGDLFLVRGGVFEINWYLSELNKLLKKHFENFGRRKSTLHLSSMELWIDGYKPSAPNRKVSIYNEGALFAFIIDIKLRMLTENKFSLDDVMLEMMNKYGDGTAGYSNKEIIEIITGFTDKGMASLCESLLAESEPIEQELGCILDWVGLKLIPQEAETTAERLLGIKTQPNDQEQSLQVISIAPDSIGEKHFSIGDMIIEVNNLKPIDGINSIQVEKQTSFKIKRFGAYYSFSINTKAASFYATYKVELDKEADQSKVCNRIKWLNLPSNGR